jgi:hypothetical protein
MYRLFSNYPSHRISTPLNEGYSPLWYGFMDESGDPAPFSQNPLVLVAVLTQSPREIEMIVHRASRKVGLRSRGGELKASTCTDKFILRILQGVGHLSVFIFAVELDKSVIVRPPKDPEAIYSRTMAHLVRACLSRFPRMELHIDKRYNNSERQVWLERSIRDELSDISGTSLVLLQADSVSCKQLQAADFLAWSAGKHAQGNDQFWEVVKEKVIGYEILQIKQWY